MTEPDAIARAVFKAAVAAPENSDIMCVASTAQRSRSIFRALVAKAEAARLNEEVRHVMQSLALPRGRRVRVHYSPDSVRGLDLYALYYEEWSGDFFFTRERGARLVRV